MTDGPRQPGTVMTASVLAGITALAAALALPLFLHNPNVGSDSLRCLLPVHNFMAGKGYIPVISPIAADDQGNNLNVNADTVAGAVAVAMRAKKLFSITDVEGVRMNPDDPSSVISEFPASDFDRLVAEKVIKGGMIPKVEACVRVVRDGVEKAHIIDGRKHHAILLELLTDQGVGTMIRRS